MKKELVKTADADIPVIAEIYMTEFSKYPYNESWTIEKATKQIKRFKKINDLYSIKIDDKVIGFITLNPNFMCPGEVIFGEEMAIRSDFQNKGIGTWVFGEIFNIYKNKGFKKFMGITDINSRAYQLYKKLDILPSKQDVLIERQLNKNGK